MMLLAQLKKRSLRKQGRHPQEGSMTQGLEVVNQLPLGYSQLVVAAKLYVSVQRWDFSLSYSLDSWRKLCCI